MEDIKPVIFKKIKTILESFESVSLKEKGNDKKYELTGTKDIFMFGREIKGMYFAGVMMQKGFVSLHYMPIYCNPKLVAEIPANLKKLLKSKSCFNIKKDDDEIYKSVKTLIKSGKAFYKKQGWI